ncbi:DUF4062 domain-containing protein [Verrucomicrobium spinosum]|uniref:DUF4062 domain-containing protein n=1 Tax=Verrucomicrobium spinosum TaxID=2736 RepID=UPI0009461FB1|nr:DUF4062 domain-containing protein [Verrucomicrobium spinosum]
MAIQIFISCASEEFRELREKLRRHLAAARCHVLTQEDFPQEPTGLLEKLDSYIRDCDVIIHIIGACSGSIADPTAVLRYLRLNEAFLTATPALRSLLGDFSTLSYTHWEGFMALHHQRRIQLYYLEGSQPQHLQRMKLALPQRHGSRFVDDTDLFGQLIGDLRDLIPPLPATQVNNLPATIGDYFRGREGTLQELHLRLGGTSRRMPLAIHGLGGIGKTRLSIEYGHRYASAYSTRILVTADTPQNLERQLAALTAPTALDLPAHHSSEETIRTAAVLRWLREHEGCS